MPGKNRQRKNYKTEPFGFKMFRYWLTEVKYNTIIYYILRKISRQFWPRFALYNILFKFVILLLFDISIQYEHLYLNSFQDLLGFILLHISYIRRVIIQTALELVVFIEYLTEYLDLNLSFFKDIFFALKGFVFTIEKNMIRIFLLDTNYQGTER